MSTSTELDRILGLILSRVSIVDIIENEVQLVKKGREYVGKCPFHSEKTASFYVNDEKGKYYCFGCGAHGNAVSYVMKMKGYSFIQAVEYLATISGVKLPEKKQYSKHNDIVKQLSNDSKFFRIQLMKNKDILKYCYSRGLDDSTISKFSLGYCPPGASGGMYKFRHRLIFPIFNCMNEVIAFGGRALRKGVVPKYINSNESEIFCKKETLYAYNLASRNISKKDEILEQYIVVEGYMDAVIMHKSGFSTTIATMGTAFSNEHLVQLWRSCNEPIICFDGDAAGRRAMLRAAFLALQYIRPGKTLRFCGLPSDHDPDSFLRENSEENMRFLLKKSLYLIDFIWEDFIYKYEQMEVKTPEHIANWRKGVLSSISVINDEELRRLYKSQLEDLMYNFLRSGRKQKYSGGGVKFVDKKNKLLLREAILLYTVIRRPSIMHDVYERMSGVSFSRGEWSRLWEEVCVNLLADEGEGIGEVIGENRAVVDDIRSIAECYCAIDGLNDAEVLSFWSDVFENYVFKAGYKNDIKVAGAECQSDCNEDTWRRLKALKLGLLKR
ncbi:MAG: toprim domain-containing protein [Holosporales bacterium]|jgi:DNA primase|nr:toprim domain-containing protein [Holosporales bacterium]